MEFYKNYMNLNFIIDFLPNLWNDFISLFSNFDLTPTFNDSIDRYYS